VALAVLGRHVPALGFLTVLLGDDPAIGPALAFYQRLLARDRDGAAKIARARMADLGAAGVMDEVIDPALVLAAQDLGRKEISPEDHALIVTGSQGIIERLRLGGIAAAAPAIQG
jgi:hypothetical protein